MSDRLANHESPEPTWDVVHLFPAQGHWSEGEYLALHTNRMVELNAGRLEVLPTPNWLHQLIIDYLCQALKQHVAATVGGTVLFAPVPVRLFPGTMREPDVLYVAPEHTPADLSGYPEAIDLVMEVVNAGAESRQRDYQDKRFDYARGGVAEYWIVDPERQQVTVLTLEGSEYREVGVYHRGDTAKSLLLPGFSLDVTAITQLGHGAKP